MGIALKILVGLEQLVAGHVGEQQVALVQYGHKSRFAPLRRGVAMPVCVGAGQDGEGRKFDEFLNVGG